MEFSVCLEEWYQLCLGILILLLRSRAVERFVFPVTPEATKVQWEHKKWFFLGQILKIIFSPWQSPVSQTPQERKGSSCHCCFWEERSEASCYREINMSLRVTSEKKKKKSYLLASKIAFLWWEFHFLSNATACILVGVNSRWLLFVFLCLSDS